MSQLGLLKVIVDELLKCQLERDECARYLTTPALLTAWCTRFGCTEEQARRGAEMGMLDWMIEELFVLEEIMSTLLAALDRICEVRNYVDISDDDIRTFGNVPIYAKVYNLRKTAQTFEETIDNVREALGLESTHYLVIADDVADVVKERDELKALSTCQG